MSSEKKILQEMREVVLKFDPHLPIDKEYLKYNDLGGENPGGKAWIMWFLDYFERLKHE